MPNKHYQRSYRAERKAFKQLEKEGYHCIRASSSKGVCDVVAIGRNDIRLVEIKAKESYRNIRKTADEKPLRDIKVPDNVSREVWYWLLNEGWRKVVF